eukprot:316645-Amphidinium_carterae.1
MGRHGRSPYNALCNCCQVAQVEAEGAALLLASTSSLRSCNACCRAESEAAAAKVICREPLVR